MVLQMCHESVISTSLTLTYTLLDPYFTNDVVKCVIIALVAY